jgi:hypothetical protein
MTTDWRSFRKPTGLWLTLKHAEQNLNAATLRIEVATTELRNARLAYTAAREALNLPKEHTND